MARLIAVVIGVIAVVMVMLGAFAFIFLSSGSVRYEATATAASTQPNREPVSVVCGQSISGELTTLNQSFYYTIPLNVRDRIWVEGESVGDYLAFSLVLLNPAREILHSQLGTAPRIESGALSSTGMYIIEVNNYRFQSGSVSTGQFTVHIGCTLADGAVINPDRPQRLTPTP